MQQALKPLVMSQLKNLDSTSVRGQRLVSLGIQTPEGINLVKAFNFNNRSILGSILFAITITELSDQ